MISPAEARALALKRLQGREPVSGEYPVRLESAPVERLTRARLALDETEEAEYPTSAHKDEAVDVATQTLQAAQQEVDDSTVVFTFEALEPDVFATLLEKHPPSDEETAQSEARGQGRPDYGATFRPALIAASCTFPGFGSAEEARAYLWGGKARLTRTEAQDMFDLALAVCEGRREVVDWGKDFARTSG